MVNGRSQLPDITSAGIRQCAHRPSNFRPSDVFLYSTGRFDWTEWLAAAKKGKMLWGKEAGHWLDLSVSLGGRLYRSTTDYLSGAFLASVNKRVWLNATSAEPRETPAAASARCTADVGSLANDDSRVCGWDWFYLPTSTLVWVTWVRLDSIAYADYNVCGWDWIHSPTSTSVWVGEIRFTAWR